MENEGWDRRSSLWKAMDAADVPTDFPILTEEEIRNITLGTYQVVMAKAYSQEHLQENGAYDILIAEDVPKDSKSPRVGQEISVLDTPL